MFLLVRTSSISINLKRLFTLFWSPISLWFASRMKWEKKIISENVFIPRVNIEHRTIANGRIVVDVSCKTLIFGAQSLMFVDLWILVSDEKNQKLEGLQTNEREINKTKT